MNRTILLDWPRLYRWVGLVVGAGSFSVNGAFVLLQQVKRRRLFFSINLYFARSADHTAK